MSWIGQALEWLRQFWVAANPSLYMQSPSPVLRRLNEDQTELSWQGAPFLFDRRSQTLTRTGSAVTPYSAVKAIIISGRRDDHEEWSVSLELGFFRSVFVGAAREQVDASIVAAHIATLMGKQVRVY